MAAFSSNNFTALTNQLVDIVNEKDINGSATQRCVPIANSSITFNLNQPPCVFSSDPVIDGDITIRNTTKTTCMSDLENSTDLESITKRSISQALDTMVSQGNDTELGLLAFGLFKQSGFNVFSITIASISFNKYTNTLCLCLCLPYVIEGALFIRIIKPEQK